MRRQRRQINLFKYILFYCIKYFLFVINDTCINLTQSITTKNFYFSIVVQPFSHQDRKACVDS